MEFLRTIEDKDCASQLAPINVLCPDKTNSNKEIFSEYTAKSGESHITVYNIRNNIYKRFSYLGAYVFNLFIF